MFIKQSTPWSATAFDWAEATMSPGKQALMALFFKWVRGMGHTLDQEPLADMEAAATFVALSWSTRDTPRIEDESDIRVHVHQALNRWIRAINYMGSNPFPVSKYVETMPVSIGSLTECHPDNCFAAVSPDVQSSADLGAVDDHDVHFGSMDQWLNYLLQRETVGNTVVYQWRKVVLPSYVAGPPSKADHSCILWLILQMAWAGPDNIWRLCDIAREPDSPTAVIEGESLECANVGAYKAYLEDLEIVYHVPLDNKKSVLMS